MSNADAPDVLAKIWLKSGAISLKGKWRKYDSNQIFLYGEK